MDMSAYSTYDLNAKSDAVRQVLSEVTEGTCLAWLGLTVENEANCPSGKVKIAGKDVIGHEDEIERVFQKFRMELEKLELVSEFFSDDPYDFEKDFFCFFDYNVARRIPFEVNPNGHKNVTLAVNAQVYDEFQNGWRDTEYRDYKEYYVKKLLVNPLKTLTLSRGYSKGIDTRIRFDIVSVSLADKDRNECGTVDADEIPEGFKPEYIAIHLKRQNR